MQLPQLQYSRSNEYRKIQSKRSKLLQYGVPVLALLGIVGVVYKCYPNESSTGNIHEIDGETKEMLMTMYGDELLMDEDLAQLNTYTKDCQVAYESQFTQNGSKFANIEYIGSGYDIFKADPNAELSDTGFRSNLYALNWGRVTQYSNGQFYPSEMQVRREVACSASVSSEVMNDEKELQDSLKRSVAVGGGGSFAGFSASFTANSDFQEQSKSFESNNIGRAKAEAQCSIYRANTIIPPCMSESLVLMLTMMEDQPTEFQMNEFFSEFGTHSVKRLQFGGMFVSQTEYSKLQRNQEREKGRDLSFSAEASGWGFSASAGASSSKNEAQSFKRDESMGKGNYWTIGSRLPEGQTVQDQLQNWIKNQEQIEQLAIPIGDKEVDPLWYTIRKSLQIRSQLTPEMDNKLKALEHHATQGRYCSYLQSNNQLQTCDAPQARGWGPTEREFRHQWTHWGTGKKTGTIMNAIQIEGKNHIMTRSQDGFGIVDIGFGVGNNFERTTNNDGNNRADQLKIKSFNGQIREMWLRYATDQGVVDILFKYFDQNGALQETGWFYNNPNFDRQLRVDDYKLPQGTYAKEFQARDEGGYGIIDARLGMMVPI